MSLSGLKKMGGASLQDVPTKDSDRMLKKGNLDGRK